MKHHERLTENPVMLTTIDTSRSPLVSAERIELRRRMDRPQRHSLLLC
jgi:hypothetical protein